MWGGDDGQMAAAGPDMSGGIWNPPGYMAPPPRGAPSSGYAASSGVQQPPRKPWDTGVGSSTQAQQQWQSWQQQAPPPPGMPPQWAQPPPHANGKPAYGAHPYDSSRGGSIPPYGRAQPRMSNTTGEQWQGRQQGAMMKTGGSEWRSDGTSHWGDPGSQHASVSHWGGSSQTPTPSMQQPAHDVTGTAHWAQQRPPPQQQQMGQQWGGPPPIHHPPPHRPPPMQQQWNAVPPHMGNTQHGGPQDYGGGGGGGGHQSAGRGGGAPGGQPPSWPDMNPQNPSMWVPPAPNDIKDDMMWHDPNPRQKKVLQADKGTAAWGDPQHQGDIKRWKSPGETADVVQDWTTSAASTSSANVENIPPVLGWGEPLNASTQGGGQPAQQPQWNQDNMQAWNAAKNPAMGGGGGAGWQPHSSAMTPSSVNQATRHHTVSGGRTHGGEEQQPPMNAQQEYGIAAAAKGMIDGQASALPPNGQRGVDLGALTQQIADQLRVAVQKRLIDVSVLNQPLPKDTLLLLNNLLQRVPRMEAAQKELQALQLSNPQPNEPQTGEVQRLQSEITLLQSEIREYQAKINNSANTPDPNSRIHRWTQPSKSSDAMSNGGDNGDPSGMAIPSTDGGNPWGSSNAALPDWSPPNTQTSGDDGKTGDGVQEFVPGRPWAYHDPAADPTATPGGMQRVFNSFGSGVGMSPSSASDLWGGGGVTTTDPSEQRLNPMQQPGYWLVFTGVQPDRVSFMNSTCEELAKPLHALQAVKPPNGTAFVCKFATDVPADQLMPRLQSLGVSVQLAKDAEVEALMTAARGGGGGGSSWPMSGDSAWAQ